MSKQVYLREVELTDLPEFFQHQKDPIAGEMAAFPARERDAFMTHWKKILADDGVAKRTIVFDSEIAGNVVCFEQSSKLLIGYWIDRRFWGQGIASRAVAEFVSMIMERPIFAYVAKHNLASIRVLEKCGFEVAGESRSAAATGGEVVDEFIYSLSG